MLTGEQFTGIFAGKELVSYYPIVELGDILQKNRKEGIFVIPVSISSKKFYTGKPTYCKNTGIP